MNMLIIYLLFGCVVDYYSAQILKEYAYGTGLKGFKALSTEWSNVLLGKRISNFITNNTLYFPIFEIVIALFLLLCQMKYGFYSLKILECTVGISILSLTSIIGLKYSILPDKCTISLIIFGIINSIFYGISSNWLKLSQNLLGGLCIGVSIYLLTYLGNKVYQKQSIGGGDLKMFVGLGLLLGINRIYIFVIIWSMLGTIASLLLIYVFKTSKWENYLPTSMFYLLAFMIMSLLY